ncbi:MAG: trypsin-like peptidase domain-containing protein [Crocinitomicaceae bacterium]|nr:trypsin-like peptidase domain-containing protein [Crocinitomicaceae bacterium]
MNEEEKIALFDAYLRNELTDEDRRNFEQLLSNNQDLRAEFDDYSALAKDIYHGEEYGEIKADLQEIHRKLYPASRGKSIFLRPRFYVPISIAASIALLFLIVNPWKMEDGKTAFEDTNEYVELTNEEEAESDEGADDEGSPGEEVEDSATIEYNVDSNYSKLDETLALSFKPPKGSCFMISNKGYFITSKHLVKKKKYAKIQQKDRNIAFYTEVIYRDSLLDFAILKCAEEKARDFKAVPFKFYRSQPSLGDDVFTLGYPKSDIVYTNGVVSSATGFRSDSMTYEISMPSNPGNSGAPLFTKKGDLVGMIIANNSKKQSVTYILKPVYIQERISSLKDTFNVDMSKNYSRRYSKTSDLINKYRPYIFEVH